MRIIRNQLPYPVPINRRLLNNQFIEKFQDQITLQQEMKRKA